MSSCRASTRQAHCPGCCPGCRPATGPSSRTTAPPTIRPPSPRPTGRTSCTSRSAVSAPLVTPACSRRAATSFASWTPTPHSTPVTCLRWRARSRRAMPTSCWDGGRSRARAPGRCTPGSVTGCWPPNCAAASASRSGISARCGPPGGRPCWPCRCRTGGSATRSRWWCAPPRRAGGSRKRTCRTTRGPASRRSPARSAARCGPSGTCDGCSPPSRRRPRQGSGAIAGVRAAFPGQASS